MDRDHLSYKPDYNKQIRQIIQNVSKKGKYQFKLVIFFMFVSLFSNIEFNSSQLFYMNPSFYCQGDIEEKVTQVDACNKLQVCTLVQTYTMTAKLDLYCDPRKEYRVFIQSAASFGSLGGIVLSFFISDRRGRKFTLCLCLIFINFGFVIQYIGIKKNILNLLWIAQIIYGFCGKTIYMNCIIICTRFLKKKLYEFVSVAWFFMSYIICQFRALTCIIIAMTNQIFHDWKLLFGLYSIGLSSLTIISFFVLHEDPIYYFDNGKYEEFIGVIKDVSNQNETNHQVLLNNLEEMKKLIASKTKNLQFYIQKSEDDDYDITKLLDCRIIQSASILGTAGFFYMMISSSLDLQLPGLKLEYDYNLIIRGVSYIIGNITSGFLIRAQLNRKTGYLLASILCGCVGIMFGFKALENEALVQIALLTILRISLCWISAFWVRLKVDLFPQKYQAAIICFIEFLSTFGKILGPFATYLSDQKDINAVFSVTLLQITLGTIPVIFLRQKKIELEAQLYIHRQIQKQ